MIEAGASVKEISPGDNVVLTVRCGCGRCGPCRMGRADFCATGEYTERGIKECDGYQAEYGVDHEKNLVKVPKEIASIGVLTEPMFVAQKAIDEAIRIQTSRLPLPAQTAEWLKGKRALVAGLGAIGLLAAFALRLRGADVFGLDVVDAGTIRPTLLTKIGGVYVDGRQVAPGELSKKYGPIDLILEVTGVARLEFDLLVTLGINRIYVLTGIHEGDRPMDIDGAALIRNLVLKNQVILDSVNASRAHFQMAVEALKKAREAWGDLIDRVITHRYPYKQFKKALSDHTPDEIKTVIDWRTP